MITGLQSLVGVAFKLVKNASRTFKWSRDTMAARGTQSPTEN